MKKDLREDVGGSKNEALEQNFGISFFSACKRLETGDYRSGFDAGNFT